MIFQRIIDFIKHQFAVLTGKQTKDRTYESERKFPDERAAKAAFAEAKNRLFDVNAWSDLPGINSTFKLHDPHGQPVSEVRPQVGYHICITIPSPVATDNWVKVTDLQIEASRAFFSVQPSADPRQKEKQAEGVVDHFFDERARSIFLVEQVGNRISAYELGRKESANNQGKQAGERSVANTLVAAGGWAFFQEWQWKKLTDYLVGV
ncbi:hypothetical protein GCM10027347_17030 [Larkinella harenae]